MSEIQAAYKTDSDAEIKIKAVNNGYILKAPAGWTVYPANEVERMLMEIRTILGRRHTAEWSDRGPR
ncbi:MAG: hypothetical protein EKK55_17270 [Rhodocyclaceae bacterium]|nr:MAG: hypothetical protein EKK55_17270 [Rhodocyclaceae bacterium]